MKIALSDLNRLEARKIILAACKLSDKTVLELCEPTGLSDSYVKKHCNKLVDKGFLDKSIIYTGRFKVRTFIYKTIRENYTISDMTLRALKVENTIKKVSSTKNRRAEIEESYKPLPNGRIIRFETKNDEDLETIARAEHYKQQQISTRLAMKSPMRGVSGSSLSAAV